MQRLVALALLLGAPASAASMPGPWSAGGIPAPSSVVQARSQVTPVAALPIPQAWTKFQDPREQAFSLEVPQNWRVQGGTLRHNALQFRNWVQVVSPDGGTIIALNDPEEGSYVVPSPLLAMSGFQVGSVYGGGGGTLYVVKPYQNGAQAAAEWGLRQLPRLCTGVALAASQELPNLTAAMNAGGSAFGLRRDAGEADFTCTRAGAPVRAHALIGVTSISGPAGAIWYPEWIEGWVAPAPLAGVAAGVVAHMLLSIRVNPDWVLNTLHTDLAVSRIAAEANQAISADIMQSWADRGAIIERVMDEGSRARLGIDVYRDPATGTTYTVANTHNFYWVNPGGAVVGTETETAPPGFSALSRVAPSR